MGLRASENARGLMAAERALLERSPGGRLHVAFPGNIASAMIKDIDIAVAIGWIAYMYY